MESGGKPRQSGSAEFLGDVVRTVPHGNADARSTLPTNTKHRGLRIVGIALDTGGTNLIKKFIAEYKIDYPVLLPVPGSALSRIDPVPTTLLIDGEGRLAKKYVGELPEKILRGDIENLTRKKSAVNKQTTEKRELTILHTNDIHGHLSKWTGWEGDLKNKTVGGLDRLAAQVANARSQAKPENVLLLDAGDTIGDTLVAAETEGRAVIETMNRIGYDAMVVGNHEPDFTAEKLLERIKEAKFPVLAANIVRKSNDELFTKPYVIKTIGGVRVGILGLAYPNTPLTSAKEKCGQSDVPRSGRDRPRIRPASARRRRGDRYRADASRLECR